MTTNPGLVRELLKDCTTLVMGPILTINAQFLINFQLFTLYKKNVHANFKVGFTNVSPSNN